MMRRPCTMFCAGLALCASVAAQDPSDRLDYWVYVAAESADEIYKVRFDGVAGEVAGVIPVGYMPTEIEGPHGLTVAPDGKHWFVTMAHGKPYGVLYKYSTENDELVGDTELGLFPATMQISRATGLLYCVNFDLHGDMTPSSVSVVDPEAMVEVARTTTGKMPHGSRLSPDGTRHFSCAMMSGELFEIDAIDFSVRRTMLLGKSEIPPGAGDAARMMAMASRPTWVHPHPSLDKVYVALNGADQIVEVDLENWQIARRFETDRGPYNLEVTPDGRKLLVSYKTAGAAGIWDLEHGKELARIPTSRSVTHGVAISSDGRYGFVSCEGKGSEKGTLDVFDLRSNTRVATVELGLQAGGIAFWRAVPRAE